MGPIEELGQVDNVPFSGEKPFIAVLEVKEDMNFINDMETDYDLSNYDEDIEKLKAKVIPTILTSEELDMLIMSVKRDAKEQIPIVIMWNTIKFLSYFIVEVNKKHTPKQEVLDTIKTEGIHNINNTGSLNLYGLTFNRLLQDTLGYDGFADKKVKGIFIHQNLPKRYF